MSETPSFASTSAEVSGALGRMAEVLIATETIETAVDLVTELAAAAIPGAAGAAVTLADENGYRTRAASDPFVEEADALQYRLDQGPCLTAWRESRTVLVEDTATDTDFPAWSAAARHVGVRSALSRPLLPPGSDAIGAIKVYARRPSAFDARAEAVLSLFARQASVLLANVQSNSVTRRLSGQLAEALVDRDVVRTATGVLLAQGAGTDDRAFQLLAEAASRSHLPVPEVARRIVDSVTRT